LADAGDAALIADLSRQTFYDTFAGQNTAENMQKFMEEQFSHEQLVREVNDPENIFMLAFSGDEPAGYAFLRPKNLPGDEKTHHAMEISRIYVLDTFIGHGVGRKLMEECIGISKKAGKELLWLGVWEHNQRAIDFYTKWGFEKFSSHPFVLGDDVQQDWLMKKML